MSLSLFLVACPTPGEAPTEKCTKRFEQCKLPEGPLGVCADVPCADPQLADCLECQPQH